MWIQKRKGLRAELRDTLTFGGHRDKKEVAEETEIGQPKRKKKKKSNEHGTSEAK